MKSWKELNSKILPETSSTLSLKVPQTFVVKKIVVTILSKSLAMTLSLQGYILLSSNECLKYQLLGKDFKSSY
jgi:hypothetical protein